MTDQPPSYRGGPTEAQLAALDAFGYRGMVPRTRREAGDWIARLRAGVRIHPPKGRRTMTMATVRTLRGVGYRGPLDVSPEIARATFDYLSTEHRRP